MLSLPKEFEPLARRRAALQAEIDEIDALQESLVATRRLVRRAMLCVGSMTRKEFESCEGYDYMVRFLNNRLTFVKGELPPPGDLTDEEEELTPLERLWGPDLDGLDSPPASESAET